jgi:GNAT superfamily N-acetyltransferase
MNIRFAEIDEYAGVLNHYTACNYGGGLDDKDMVVVAIDEQVTGAVRICIENGIKVLRGMQIKPAWQKKGIGSLMLKFLADNVDMNGCYCLPFKHLKIFYGLIGFAEILLQDAPEFLRQRLEKYLSLGHDEMIIMMINKNV